MHAPLEGPGGAMARRHFMLGAAVLGVGAAAVPLRRAPERPVFRVPFNQEASVHTWYLTQYYGNTTFAYRMRREFYAAGQGLHFGVDLAARCGTPVRAIADGVVREVDGPQRAWPHHIVIDHPEGVSSLYGHLLERAVLRRGESVRAGDVIAVSGDSATLNCNGAPHVHLEIRYDEMRAATNPIPWIDADWPALSLGLAEAPFQVDLEAPSRWQSIYHQPDVRFSGPALNAYVRTWPVA